VREHWARFGRHYYSRHDYEGVDSTVADTMMARLRTSLPSLAGRTMAGFRVRLADDFSYTDPIDHSVASKQGIRIVMTDGSRIVLRLSGTGTEGATVRIYHEKFEADPAHHALDPQQALAGLIGVATELSGIRQFSQPSVIT
jgi:phosphoglucomutase